MKIEQLSGDEQGGSPVCFNHSEIILFFLCLCDSAVDFKFLLLLKSCGIIAEQSFNFQP